MLKQFAYFGNQSLWYELFTSGLSDDSQWLRQTISNKSTFIEAMRTLTDYCFLEIHSTSESWSIHNCVYDWTLAALNKEFDPHACWYAVKCIDVRIVDIDEFRLQSTQYSCLAAHATRFAIERFLQEGVISYSAAELLSTFSRFSLLLQCQIELDAAERISFQVLVRKL